MAWLITSGAPRVVLAATLAVALLPVAARAADQPAQPAVAAPAAAPAAAKPPASEETGTPATVIDEKSIESILGRPVLSPTGEDIGRIADVLVDKAGDLRAVIIDFGGFFGVGSRKIAVDWHALHVRPDGKGGDTIVADLPQNRLRTAPVYKEGEPVVVLGRASSDRAPTPAASATPAPAAQPAPAATAPAGTAAAPAPATTPAPAAAPAAPAVVTPAPAPAALPEPASPAAAPSPATPAAAPPPAEAPK